MLSFDALLQVVPRVEYFPDFDPTGQRDGEDFRGIRALAYDGVDLRGEHTKVFAHIGFPENASGGVPAVVLVHGGGGHPEDKWIRLWNRRGYAAISMDTTGYFPQSPAPYYVEGFADGLERKLASPFAQEGYTVSPGNSGMRDGALPIGDQWMYHAVAQVILAHNILRAHPRIDRNRIGLTGISWGGVIASVAIGFDTRFAFAIPVYGSAYLGSGYPEICRRFRNPDVFPWLAERRLDNARMPVMWLCWNDDCAFSLNSNSLSWLHSQQVCPDSRLCMLDGMGHSHRQGYMPEESYWFADMILSGDAIPRIWAEYGQGRVRCGCSAPVRSARLFWLDGAIRYVRREKYGMESEFMDRGWHKMTFDPGRNEIPLPEGAIGKYVEFTLENGIVLTTPYSEA